MTGTVTASGSGSVTFTLIHQGNVSVTLPVTGRAPAVGSAIVLGVRPEHFGLAGAGIADLALDIDVAEHLGATSYIYANTARGEQLIVEREESRNELGRETVSVSIPADTSYLFDSTGQRIR